MYHIINNDCMFKKKKIIIKILVILQSLCTWSGLFDGKSLPPSALCRGFGQTQPGIRVATLHAPLAWKTHAIYPPSPNWAHNLGGKGPSQSQHCRLRKNHQTMLDNPHTALPIPPTRLYRICWRWVSCEFEPFFWENAPYLASERSQSR